MDLISFSSLAQSLIFLLITCLWGCGHMHLLANEGHWRPSGQTCDQLCQCLQKPKGPIKENISEHHSVPPLPTIHFHHALFIIGQLSLNTWTVVRRAFWCTDSLWNSSQRLRPRSSHPFSDHILPFSQFPMNMKWWFDTVLCIRIALLWLNLLVEAVNGQACSCQVSSLYCFPPLWLKFF